MAEQIPDDRWPPIDANIVANHKLPAIKDIRALTGCSLHEALRIYCERYAKLRAASPEQFDCSDAEYWQGFDS